MRVLLDNNVNHRFARLLTGHEVIHARNVGWAELENGALISVAEDAKFDVVVTADKRMQHQQVLTNRKISVLVLNSKLIKWEFVEPLSGAVQKALDEGFPQGVFFIIDPEP